MSFVTDIFGTGSSNPASQAMPYLQQIPGTITPYYQPYIDSGNSALNQLMQQFSTLLTNPGQTNSMLGSSYQASPGYQYSYNQGMNAINNAAASGGMLGTPAHQQEAGAMATGLASQDYDKYMNNQMKLYGMGLQGEGDINQMGYRASDSLASALASNLMNQGNMAYAQQSQENQSANDIFSSLVSLLTGGLTAYNYY